MFWMEPALPVEDRVFPFTSWTFGAISLGAVPSVIRIRAYTACRSVRTVRLLMPIPLQL
jgi:hypothetical protein